MKNNTYYLLGTILGFLIFALSMSYVDKWVLLSIVGLSGAVFMGYCVFKILQNKMGMSKFFKED